MSEVKHTPGPWHVHDHDNRFLFIDSQTEGSVCKIANNPRSKSNARLIAAAPELLEAIEKLFRSVQNEMAGRGLPLEWTSETPMGIAEAAIRKART